MPGAKRTKARRAAPSRLDRLSRIPSHLIKLARCETDERCLDPDAPLRPYRIDEFAEYFQPFFGVVGVSLLRQLVEAAAVAAAYDVENDLLIEPVRAEGKRFISTIEKARTLLLKARRLAESPETRAGLQLGGNRADADLLLQDCADLLLTNHLKDLACLEVCDPAPPNADRFSTNFIGPLFLVWTRSTGQAPEIGLEGPFVRFLEAAWLDLHLPEPLDRSRRPAPLRDWLRDRAKQVARKIEPAKKRRQSSS